jgi:iron complex outermembrane receptor protein
VDGHRQEETDVDGDGWSDLPGYRRGALRQRTLWSNGQGRSAAGVAGVTFHKREGGSVFAREALETKTADGGLSGETTLDNGYILAGAGILFVQSRTRDFSDGREGDRLQTATIEITRRRPSARHTWLAGVAADWYAIRSGGPLVSTCVSTRPGIFVHDDFTVAPWLVVSGSARLDHHNLYGLLLSPRGSALVRSGPWAARVSAAQGYHTPRPLMEETEAAGLSRLTIEDPLEVETAHSVSADFTHTTNATTVSFSVFRSHIDDPAQIDRATYTLRNEPDPIVSQGVEMAGRVRLAPFSATATYTHLRTRERNSRPLALTPRHSVGAIAAAEGSRGRIGVEVLFTGEQRLDANPFRSTSEPYTLVGFLGEYRLGRWRLFLNGDNLTDVRQTDWDPIQRPSQDIDGRWTVDAWAPLGGRVINGGIRAEF